MTVQRFWLSRPVEISTACSPGGGSPGPRTLDDLVDRVQQHGLLYLHNHDDGTWSARCRLSVLNAPGATFDVSSGFRHRTPHSALEQLLDNIRTGHGK